MNLSQSTIYMRQPFVHEAHLIEFPHLRSVDLRDYAPCKGNLFTVLNLFSRHADQIQHFELRYSTNSPGNSVYNEKLRS